MLEAETEALKVTVDQTLMRGLDTAEPGNAFALRELAGNQTEIRHQFSKRLKSPTSATSVTAAIMCKTQ